MSSAFDDLRITDAEREAAAASLGEHYALGRLTKQEYDERADLAWKAKTRGELSPVFVDLPGPATDASAAREQRPRPYARPHPYRHGPWGFPRPPLMAVIVLLAVLTAITQVPFLLLGLVAWLVLGSRVRH